MRIYLSVLLKNLLFLLFLHYTFNLNLKYYRIANFLMPNINCSYNIKLFANNDNFLVIKIRKFYILLKNKKKWRLI
jgi:hypothetical protein